LAKQARQLVHIHFETQGIDFLESKLKTKALVHQLNQQTGKSYWKYLRIRVSGRVRTVQRMYWGLPSAKIMEKYEAKKAKFLSEMTTEFVKDLEKKEKDKLDKMARDDLTEKQRRVYNWLIEGKEVKEIANIEKSSDRAVYYVIEAIINKGYEIIPKKNEVSKVRNNP